MSAYNKGIASNPIIHKFASAKGGKVRTKKGLAKLSPERRREIAALGGKTSADKRRREAEQSSKDSSMERDRVPGDIDGEEIWNLP